MKNSEHVSIASMIRYIQRSCPRLCDVEFEAEFLSVPLDRNGFLFELIQRLVADYKFHNH